jgi:xanthine dehydrogenase accessory factor
VNENENLAGIIVEQLGQNSPVVLASILSIQGSSPRHTGTKMVIGGDGRPHGTIGGSLLEAVTIQKSRQALESRHSVFMEFELSGKDAYAAGMICGGKAELLLDYLPATPENQALFQAWRQAAREGRDFYFLTHYRKTGETVDVLDRTLLYPDGEVVVGGQLKTPDLDTIKSELHNISGRSVISSGDSAFVVDRIQKLKTLYLFGAGHVALPTAHIAALVNFRVVVVDDRAEFANRERFPEADEICVVKDLTNALEGLEIDADSFVVIVTRGHKYDRAVLEQSLKTGAGYIGMISSRRKRDAVYEALMSEGVKRSELEQVHSPIGLPIGGETPEEIAVSIVAELIAQRSQQQGPKK